MYFDEFIRLTRIKSDAEVYADFVSIYELVLPAISESVLRLIRNISLTYCHYAKKAELAFAEIYYGMVAEENKDFAPLKKRIKRLGMHQLLIEQMSAKEAANFSRDMKAPYLATLCRERGF